MKGFTDIHHHIVWGVDDGPATLNSSVKMLHAASDDDIRRIIATTHANPGIVEFDQSKYLERIGMLNEYCQAHKLNLVIYPGAEVLYTEKAAQLLYERRIPTLAGSEFTLVEFMQDEAYEQIYEAMRSLTNSGFVPVIAHVERYKCLVRKPALLEELKSMFYMRIQMNCHTVLNPHGRQIKKFVSYMLKNGMVDYVATDAHNIRSRPVFMYDCYAVLEQEYGAHYAQALTGRNQREILRRAEEKDISAEGRRVKTAGGEYKA